MEYHLKLFDPWVGAKWTRKTKEGLQFTMAPQTDLKQRLNRRHGGEADLLDRALEIRRQVIHYDNGKGVPVYYIRLAQEPTQATIYTWKASFQVRKVWVVAENGTLEGDDPWAEYVASKEERDAIAWFAGPKRALRWPIVDPSCVALLRGAENPTPSKSGSVSRSPDTSLHQAVMVPKIYMYRATRRTSTHTNINQEQH